MPNKDLIPELSEKQIDELLAYTPKFDHKNLANIKARSLEKINHKEQPTMKKTTIRRSFGTAAAACLAILLTGITVFAAVRFLTPSEIAYQIGDPSLSAAFESEDATHINESVYSGGYRFTFLSLVSGYVLSDAFNPARRFYNRTYLVMAVEKEDGSPMVDFLDEAPRFYISPYIRGYNPWQVNLHTLGGEGGGQSEIIVDGIRYIVTDMENFKAFAGHGVYIGINTGWLFDRDAFIFNADPWELRANPDFDGVSIVFELPICLSFADSVRATEILEATEVLQAALQGATDFNDGLLTPPDELELPYFYEVPPSSVDFETLQRDGFIRMDYNSYQEWMNQRLAALTTSGDYGADVIAMFRAEHLRNLEAIRNGYHIYLFEDASGSGLIRVLHNPADGDFTYDFRIGDEGTVYIEYGLDGSDVGWGVPLN